jgi:hypothetical protein
MVKYPAERVPLPRRDGLAASIRALGRGESFLIPDPKATARRVVHATAVRLGVPVSIRKVENGLRVYRLAEWPRRRRDNPFLGPDGQAKPNVFKNQIFVADEDQDWGVVS